MFRDRYAQARSCQDDGEKCCGMASVVVVVDVDIGLDLDDNAES